MIVREREVFFLWKLPTRLRSYSLRAIFSSALYPRSKLDWSTLALSRRRFLIASVGSALCIQLQRLNCTRGSVCRRGSAFRGGVGHRRGRRGWHEGSKRAHKPAAVQRREFIMWKKKEEKRKKLKERKKGRHRSAGVVWAASRAA